MNTKSTQPTDNDHAAVVPAAAALRDEIRDIVTWCTSYDYDVDASAFCSAAYRVAAQAARLHGLRLPQAITPESGLLALDAACSYLGMAMPTELYGSRLPGHKMFALDMDEPV